MIQMKYLKFIYYKIKGDLKSFFVILFYRVASKSPMMSLCLVMSTVPAI